MKQTKDIFYKSMEEKYNKRCEICGRHNSEIHHIKTRGSGGTHDNWNLIYLCRDHHQEIHRIGVITFMKYYLAFERYLKNNGWTITDSKIYRAKDEE